ncbi:uncharacterized protein B0H64DRAFT_451522 [Chaetomium fimeti]|uniref:2EXR domain-containing protein n=1 Tax=Chaetomium fimeti TaxID=1854472 RepID=A0AAE0LNA9_9PEZI|nr:hypothetical protein B0H64DRAFT_451522 [Chaetomium fimeti]
MDQTGELAAENEDDGDVRLFNDVYWSSVVPRATDDTRWFPFRRLPPELRLHIWWLFLQKHRMIELNIFGDRDSPYNNAYADRNHLNKVVSGRAYRVEIHGRGYAVSLSPLLWVNSESRQATLGYYRVHLPFPGPGGDRVLYLNPEHDVLDLGGSCHPHILPDFVYDVRAYDPQDRGITHLAIREMCFAHYPEDPSRPYPYLNPTHLHPAAAEAFADALRSTLRSVLCVIKFRSCMRGTGQPPPGMAPYHFAQTLPLRRRGVPVGSLSWFETDPRWGVEFDLGTLILGTDAERVGGDWERLEKAFGVHSRPKDSRFRFYICPALNWPRQSGVAGREKPLLASSREGLAQHLREEDADWLSTRQHLWDLYKKHLPGRSMMAKHGPIVDAATSQRMESVPSTAIGLWLFPPEAFKERILRFRPYHIFNVPPVRPGLFLFDV